jgi:hypothetical protein
MYAANTFIADIGSKAMKIEVDLHDESVTTVLVRALQEQYDSLNQDLDARRSGAIKYGVFKRNCEDDINEIIRHMDSIATVLSFNMTHDDFKKWRRD